MSDDNVIIDFFALAGYRRFGEEIESYFSVSSMKEAIENVHSKATVTSKLGKYDSCLLIKTANGNKTQASKVKVAKYISKNKTVDLSILDLRKQITGLVTFIKDSNPANNDTNNGQPYVHK